MSRVKLSKVQRKELSAKKRERRKNDIENARTEVQKWLGLGGLFSTLELVVLASEKLCIQVNGKIHQNQQIKYIARKIHQSEKPINNVKTKKDFYSSRLWKILRYQAFEKYGNRCACCGADSCDGVKFHVDHIKPRSTNPELELDINNLQVLCEDCNIGKLNQWDTDWRP